MSERLRITSDIDVPLLVDAYLQITNKEVNDATSGLFGLSLEADQLFTKSLLPRVISATTRLTTDTLTAASINHSFPSPEDTPLPIYDALLAAAEARQELGREMIVQLVEKNGYTFGLAHHELGLLVTGCKLAYLYDGLGFMLRGDFAFMQDKRVKVAIQEQNLKNPYSIVRLDEAGRYNQLTYVQAYPALIKQIASGWRELLAKPEFSNTTDASAISFGNFLRLYAEALECDDLGTIEQKWHEVDEAWMKLEGKLQIIPGREAIYDDIRISPDLRIAVVAESHSEVVQKTSSAQVDSLRQRYGTRRTFTATAGIFEKTRLYPISEIVKAGGTLDFPILAQALPDNFDIKLRMGTKVFLNTRTILDRADRGLDLAIKAFPIDRCILLSRVIPDAEAVRIIGFHEINEGLFETEENQRAYPADIWRDLNEDRATLCSLAAVYDLVENGKLPEINLLTHAIFLLNISLRYLLIGRGAEQLRPYYKMAVLILKRMRDAGFITRYEGDIIPGFKRKWVIDTGNVERLEGKDQDDLKLHRFYHDSFLDLDNQVELMENPDVDKARRYLVRAKDDDPYIQELISLVTNPAEFPFRGTVGG